MVQYYPENTWDHVDLFDATSYYQRRLHAKQPHYRTPSRRRSISKPQHRQPPSPPLPPSPSQQYPWHYYFEDEQDIYEPPLTYWESHETLPDDLMLDDYDDDDYDYDYIYAAPAPRWSSFATRPPPQRRRSLASHYHQPDYDYAWNDDDDNKYLTNENERIAPRRLERRSSKGYHYTDARRQQRRRSIGAAAPQPTIWDSDYGDYHSDDEDNTVYSHYFQHQEKTQPSRRHSIQHHQHRQHTTPWIHSPVMGSPEPTSSPHTSSVLHQPSRYARMEQGPSLLSIDTQQQQPLPTSFYGQGPPVPPPLLPLPQPMMPPLSSFINYGFPTLPTIMPPAPFNPMMMPQPQPRYLPEKPALTSSSSASPTIAAPAPPPSDDAKSPSSAPDFPTTTASPVNTTTGENALVPLARSLSLGTSQPLGTHPSGRRRRSLFGSLFGSGSSNNDHKPLNSSSSVTSSPSLIPVHALTKDSLTRKQSLSLEKKAKALSQRSYIWCYRIKPSLTTPASAAWMAMAPRNQTKMDPYLCFYQPSAVVKALIRTENLPTLVTLDKEPELTGSITVMPQAKIARVYPSMFSSSNYLELLIDCLPADSQFVVRSD